MTSLNRKSPFQLDHPSSISIDRKPIIDNPSILSHPINPHARSHSLHLLPSTPQPLNLLSSTHAPQSDSSSLNLPDPASTLLSDMPDRSAPHHLLHSTLPAPTKLFHTPTLTLKHQAIRASHRRNSSLTSLAPSPLPAPASAPLPGQPPVKDVGALQLDTDGVSEQDSPLAAIEARLPALPAAQQEPIRRTLELISALAIAPPFPLTHAWTLFFSDTSQTAKTPVRAHHSAHGQRETSLLRAAEYQSGMAEVFRGVGDVESLCGALCAFKRRVADAVRVGALCAPPSHALAHGRKDGSLDEGLGIPGAGLGLGVLRPQQNLHFFRVGVNPVWEDPWNAKGGRLTISPSLAMLDSTFEALVLLIAGGVLECDAQRPGQADGGRVVGVVGSRRHRGDRIEVWLSGPSIGSAPQEEWVKSVQSIIAREIGTAESKIARFKKHLP